MPEGDTVLRTAARLHEALGGRRLIRCELRVPALAGTGLGGRTVLEVVARGKHLLTRFDGGLTLHSHLRMDGAWRVHPVGEPWRGGPGHTVRAVLGVPEHTAVGYRLPVLELLRTADEARVVGHLGPDLLGPGWDPAEAVRRLVAEPERAIGSALLDQRVLAGIGNVFMAELCFVARVTPWTRVRDCPAPERLVGAAKRLLEANRERPDRTTTSPAVRARSPRERLYVYGRAGRPCLVCGAPVLVAAEAHGRVVGRERPVYWCPGCQAGPGPVG